MIAIAISDHRISACNAKSKKGNRLRYDRYIRAGEWFVFVEFFTATGMATHGSKCIRVCDKAGNVLSTFAENYKIE